MLFAGIVTAGQTNRGAEIFLQRPEPGAPHAIAFSPDGKYLVSSSGDWLSWEKKSDWVDDDEWDLLGDGAVRVWDAERGILLRTLFHSDTPTVLVFQNDGQSLVSVSDSRSRSRWNFSTGVLLETNGFGTGYVPTVPYGYAWAAASSDGSVIAIDTVPIGAGNVAPFVEVWDTRTVPATRTYRASPGGNLALSADGSVLVVADNTRLTIHDTTSTNATGRVVEAELGSTISTIAFSPDGRNLAVGSYDGEVQIWDTARWSPKHQLAGTVTASWL
jgi:WD40 repeat protein